MLPGKTAQLIETIVDSEQNLHEFVHHHGYECTCDLCGLWRHIYAIERTMEQPGWEMEKPTEVRE